MNRAVGAYESVVTVTWGVAPCWYELGLWPTIVAMLSCTRIVPLEINADIPPFP